MKLNEIKDLYIKALPELTEEQVITISRITDSLIIAESVAAMNRCQIAMLGDLITTVQEGKHDVSC